MVSWYIYVYLIWIHLDRACRWDDMFRSDMPDMKLNPRDMMRYDQILSLSPLLQKAHCLNLCQLDPAGESRASAELLEKRAEETRMTSVWQP